MLRRGSLHSHSSRVPRVGCVCVYACVCVCLGVHTCLEYRVCLSPYVGDGYALSVLSSLSWWSVLVNASSPRVCLGMCLGVQGHARGVYYTGTCWRGEFWKDDKRFMKKHEEAQLLRGYMQVHTRESPRVAQVLHSRAGVYLKPKIIIFTRGPPSPSTRPIAPIGGA